jgi:nucleoside-diphosphate-sugar epimerase
MKLLVLGGSLFLGRHAADAARRRGHEVTIFHRGTRPPHRPDLIERRGDRDPDKDAGLSSLRDGQWDAVIDTSGYIPRHVRASVALARERGARAYVFVSSVNAYPKLPAGLDESHPSHEPLEGEELDGRTYGPLKVACERAVFEAFGDRGVSVRAGLIVGPEDQTNRFTYWCTRIAAGGTVLAPDTRDQPVQVVDVRDLAEFLVHLAEQRESDRDSPTKEGSRSDSRSEEKPEQRESDRDSPTKEGSLAGRPASTDSRSEEKPERRVAEGEPEPVVNVAGPRGAVTFRGLLEKILAVTGSDARIVWVDEERLLAEGVQPWGQLPLWVPPKFDMTGVVDSDDQRARRWGATFRPIEETIRDTLAWASVSPPARGLEAWLKVPPAGLALEREAELLAKLDPVS